MSNEHPWRNEELLRQKYWGEGMSSVEMADEFDCTKACVLKWMRRHGIERRKPKPERHIRPYTVSHGYVQVSNVHNGEEYTATIHRLLAIAKYGFDEVKGKEVHHINNIPWDNRPDNIELLSRWEHHAKHAKNSNAPWQNKELLKEKLEHMTQSELASEWGCNQSMISRWSKRHGLRD